MDTISLTSVIVTATFDREDQTIPTNDYGENLAVEIKLHDPSNANSCTIAIGDKVFIPEDLQAILDSVKRVKNVATLFKS